MEIDQKVVLVTDVDDIMKAIQVQNEVTYLVYKLLSFLWKTYDSRELRLPHLKIPEHRDHIQHILNLSVQDGPGYDGCNLSISGTIFNNEFGPVSTDSFFFPLHWLYLSPESLKQTYAKAVQDYRESEYGKYLEDRLEALSTKRDSLDKDIKNLKKELNKLHKELGI